MLTFLQLALTYCSILNLSHLVQGHGYMMSPAPRTKQSFSDAEDKHGCPTGDDKNAPRTEFQAGAEMDISYPRNNHIGGFIRYAIIPAGEPETVENFNKNVFFYHCRELIDSCKPPGGYNFYASDNGPDNSLICERKVKLPTWLKQGDYTLQWIWYASGSSFGKPGMATENYKTCANIKITSDGTGSPATCPAFEGGDRVGNQENKGNDVCLYFHTNDIPTSVYETPNSGDYNDGKIRESYKYGAPKQIEECKGNSNSYATNSTSEQTPEKNSPEETPEKTYPEKNTPEKGPEKNTPEKGPEKNTPEKGPEKNTPEKGPEKTSEKGPEKTPQKSPENTIEKSSSKKPVKKCRSRKY